MAKKQNIDSLVRAPGAYKAWYNSPGSVVEISNTPTEARIGVRKLIRDISDPLSRREKPYTNRRIEIERPHGTLYTTFNSAGTTYYKWRGDLPAAISGGYNNSMTYFNALGSAQFVPRETEWPLNPDLLSQAEVKAYAALRNKYKELDSSSYLSPGIWFGERKETAALLRDAAVTFGRFVQGVRSMKARDVSRAIMDFRADLKPGAVYRRVKRELALMRNRLLRKQKGEVILRRLPQETVLTANRLVLAYNLGVSPLLKDLDAAYKATLQSVADPSRLVIKAEGWVIRQEDGSNRRKYDRDHIVETVAVKHVLRHHVTIVCSPAETELAYLERAGLANAPSTLAELTGCSFILNYFYPILDYLKATSTPLGFVFDQASYSVKVSHEQTARYESTSRTGQGVATGLYRHIEHRRKLYGAFPVPIPPLSFRTQDLTADQAVNVTTVALEKASKALGL
jgi:hypothetical protein